MDNSFDIRGTVRSVHIFLGLGALAVGLIVGAFFIGNALSRIRSSGDVLTVTGSAKQSVQSDFAVWRGEISLRDTRMEDAYHRLHQSTERFKGWLKDQNVPDSAVVFGNLSSWQIPEVGQNGRETGRISGYNLTQQFEMRSSDVAGLTRLSNEASALLAEGVPLNSQPIEYLYTKLSDLRISLLTQATEDARERATAIAQATGSKIGKVTSARQGVYQVTRRNSTEVSNSGMYDTSSPDKDVTAVVSVSFEVK